MRLFISLIFIACSVTACRSRDATSKRTEPQATQTAASSAQATALAKRLCTALHVVPGQRVSACCGGSPTHYLFDECVSALEGSLQRRAVTLDAQAVARCAESVEQSLGGCDWVTPSQPLPPDACQGLIQGLVREGGACRSSLECAAPLHCRGLTGGGVGRCRAPQPNGASCAPGPDSLASFLLERSATRAHPTCAEFCSPSSQRCERTPAPGAACMASVHCARGQRCLDGQCADSPAAPRAESGASCTTDLECGVGGCARGSDGEKRCGMKCSASIAELASGGPKLALPARTR
jgi:hypothetical protein